VTTAAAPIVDAVRSGAAPDEAVRRSLAAIVARDGAIGAFDEVRDAAARAEAAALSRRSELRRLPLAGVPVAVKALLDPDGDHLVVQRLRAAGAVIVGTTRMPEACLWPTTDGGGVVTRNPWSPGHSAGGSSGGSGAAVAAGLVPMAHGTDSLGSVRIPASACGVVGVKPGHGVVAPVGLGSGDWSGLTEHGVLATTVRDAALMLSVLAADAGLGKVSEPRGRLRVGVAVNPPQPGVPVRAGVVRATYGVAAALRAAGHDAERTRVRYPATLGAAVAARWFAAAADQLADLPPALGAPERRTRVHAALGRRSRAAIRPSQVEAWRRLALRHFDRYDVLVTPVLAGPPLRAVPWSERSWAANVAASVLCTGGGFAAAWNLAGFPAVSVPGGVDAGTGLPVGVQLVGPPGAERLLLGLAATVERARPWPRTAPAG
jgi:amidase